VARIGEDFDVAAIERLGVDQTGVAIAPGPAPRLTINQLPGGDRTFVSRLGVAASPQNSTFPPAYRKAGHVHLATMPPVEQLHWLHRVREVSDCSISVDMFEATAADMPEESRSLCYSADLVFMNERERQLLFSTHSRPAAGILLKLGPEGAAYEDRTRCIRVPAPPVAAIDTTGAGEVLAGAFLSLRAVGVAIPEALTFAVEIASAKVTEFGVDGPNLRRAIAGVRAKVEQRRLNRPVGSQR
jgi:ribokinase